MPLPQYYDYVLTFDDAATRKPVSATVRAARILPEGKYVGAYAFLDHKGVLVATHRYVRSVTAAPSTPTHAELLAYIAELEAAQERVTARLRRIQERARDARFGNRATTLRAIRAITYE